MAVSYDNVTLCLRKAIKLCQPQKNDKTSANLAARLKKVNQTTARLKSARTALGDIRAARDASDLPALARADKRATARYLSAQSAARVAMQQADKARAAEEAAHGELHALRAVEKLLQDPSDSTTTAQLLNNEVGKIVAAASSRPVNARLQTAIAKCQATVVEATRVKSGTELAARHAQSAVRNLPTMSGAVVATKRALALANRKLQTAESALTKAQNRASAPIAHLLDLRAATEAVLKAATERDHAALERQRVATERQRRLDDEHRRQLFEEQWERERAREEATRVSNPCTCSETTRCHHCWYQQNYPTRETGMCD